MESFKKKSLIASIIVTSINIAILFILDVGIEIIIGYFDYINNIYIYFLITIIIVILIELILFMIRINSGVSIVDKLLINKYKTHLSSNLDFMGMWWAFSTWAFPFILHRLILWKYNFHETSPFFNGEVSFHLGNIIVLYMALRTFVEWQIYRKSLDPNLP